MGSQYNLDPDQFSYPSPLEGYEGLDALPETKAADGKSYENPQTGVLSEAYERFVQPISNGGPHDKQLPGFDVHVYFNTQDEYQTRFTRELWERIRREFPELRIYPIWTTPQGPHEPGMFEVAIFTPAQFGAFVSWLVVNRGPLSALVHTNTDDELKDHIHNYAWLGPEVPLNMDIFKLRPECETYDSKRNVVTRITVNDGQIQRKSFERD